MKHILPTLLLFWSLQLSAVLYDANEIERELSQITLHEQTQNYLTQYFVSKEPDAVIDSLLNADLIPLHKEYILFTLLHEISQQPPQPYFQNFIDLMKQYPVEASQQALEGPFPVAIFNINGKANGIENIWTAYRTEQQFSQLFNSSLQQAVLGIKDVIQSGNRPQWLGVKNSIAALTMTQKAELAQYLLIQAHSNSGLDQLISHVGLLLADENLIKKALQSDQQSVRQQTLRQLPQALPSTIAQNILLAAIDAKKDHKLSFSMLQHYIDDDSVKSFVMEQLNNQELASQAAFVLSLSNDINLAEQLKRRYLQSSSQVEQNHILLALKLNKSDAAEMAIEDLKSNKAIDQKNQQWLNSFKGAKR